MLCEEEQCKFNVSEKQDSVISPFYSAYKNVHFITHLGLGCYIGIVYSDSLHFSINICIKNDYSNFCETYAGTFHILIFIF